MSRILGMIRDIVSAKSFGTTWQWDALVYAFMLPNFLRRLVGEGAVSSAFIPVYAQITQKEGAEAASRFAGVVFTILFWGLVSLLGLLEIVLLFLLRIPSLAPVVHFTFELLQVLFPYLFFIALTALATGIQNCHHRFFSASLSPVILDLVWIIGVLWICPRGGPRSETRVFLLALCLLVSGALQLGSQLPSVFRCGFSPRFVFDFRHPGLVRVAKLLLPALLGFAVVQINILVDMTMGLWCGAGANSSLWYGNRVMQFPLGVFAIAMGTAVLPAISHQTARQEIEEAKRTLAFALRVIFFIVLPSTAGLIALRTPIIQLLFQRGAFDAASTARTSFVLLCYTIGLFAYSGTKIIVTGFYSVQDTKTPMKIGAVALIANVFLNLILMQFLREAGLALATSLSGILNFALLVYLFQKKVGGFRIDEVLTSSMRILGASLLMGALAGYLFNWIHGAAVGGETLRLFLGVFGSISLSTLLYLGFCLFLRVPEIHEAIEWIRSRKQENLAEKAGEEPL